MKKIIDIVFNLGMSVDAKLDNGKTIRTDLSIKDGGEDTAPTSFDLFQAAMATCAGVHAKKFCDQHNLDNTGLALRAELAFDEKETLIQSVTYHITLPPNFPKKYHDALVQAVDQCPVQKNVLEAPKFHVRLA